MVYDSKNNNLLTSVRENPMNNKSTENHDDTDDIEQAMKGFTEAFLPYGKDGFDAVCDKYEAMLFSNPELEIVENPGKSESI